MKNKYEIRGDVTIIYLDRKDGTRLETVIDTVDFEKVDKINTKFNAGYSKDNDSFYARTNITVGHKKQKGIILHRYIVDCPDDMVVDHINHDTLDNRRINLRIVTRKQNSENLKGPRKDNKTSGALGVHWSKTLNKWCVRVVIDGKKEIIGHYEDLEQAKEVSSQSRAKYYPNSKESRQISVLKDGIVPSKERARSNNKSNKRNVSWNKSVGKWQVDIMVNYKTLHFGYFDDITDAENKAEEVRSTYKQKGVEALKNLYNEFKEESSTKSFNNNQSSGVRNVYWHKSSGKWLVKFRVDNIQKHYGTFKDFDEAVELAGKIRNQLNKSFQPLRP